MIIRDRTLTKFPLTDSQIPGASTVILATELPPIAGITSEPVYMPRTWAIRVDPATVGSQPDHRIELVEETAEQLRYEFTYSYPAATFIDHGYFSSLWGIRLLQADGEEVLRVFFPNAGNFAYSDYLDGAFPLDSFSEDIRVFSVGSGTFTASDLPTIFYVGITNEGSTSPDPETGAHHLISGSGPTIFDLRYGPESWGARDEITGFTADDELRVMIHDPANAHGFFLDLPQFGRPTIIREGTGEDVVNTRDGWHHQHIYDAIAIDHGSVFDEFSLLHFGFDDDPGPEVTLRFNDDLSDFLFFTGSGEMFGARDGLMMLTREQVLEANVSGFVAKFYGPEPPGGLPPILNINEFTSEPDSARQGQVVRFGETLNTNAVNGVQIEHFTTDFVGMRTIVGVNTEFEFGQTNSGRTFIASLRDGRLRLDVPPEEDGSSTVPDDAPRAIIDTPITFIILRGTDVEVTHEEADFGDGPSVTTIEVFSGEVEVTDRNTGETQILTAGQTVTVTDGPDPEDDETENGPEDGPTGPGPDDGIPGGPRPDTPETPAILGQYSVTGIRLNTDDLVTELLGPAELILAFDTETPLLRYTQDFRDDDGFLPDIVFEGDRPVSTLINGNEIEGEYDLALGRLVWSGGQTDVLYLEIAEGTGALFTLDGPPLPEFETVEAANTFLMSVLQPVGLPPQDSIFTPDTDIPLWQLEGWTPVGDGPVDGAVLNATIRGRSGALLDEVEVTFFTADGGARIATPGDDGAFELALEPGVSGRLEVERAYDPMSDGNITPLDALEVLRLAVGLAPSWGSATPLDFIAADINQDGQVTALDALEVLRAAVGLEGSSQPRWVFLDDGVDLTAVNRDNTVVETAVQVEGLSAGVSELSMTGVLLGSIQEFA